MDSPEAVVGFSRPRLRWREYAVSLVVTVILCAALYRSADLHGFTAGLVEASYALLIPALLLQTIGWVLRAVRWRALLSPFSGARVIDQFKVLMVGSMISAVIPARAGELWRAHALGRQEGLSRSTVFGTIVVERVLDTVVLVMLASVAALAIGPTTPLAILIGSMTALSIAGLALIAILARSERAQALASTLVTSVAPKRFRAFASDTMGLFLHGLGVLRDRRLLLRAVFLSFAIYALDSAAYWMMGASFGLHVSLQSYLLVVAVANLAVAIPISIGGIGPYEFFVQKALVLLGASSAVALALAVFMHALTLVLVVALGLLSVWLGLRRHPIRPEAQAALATQN